MGRGKPPLWNHPKRGAKSGIVPHNQNRNLSVHTSISAQDAAAFCRLFGGTQTAPRSCFSNRQKHLNYNIPNTKVMNLK